MSPARRPGPGGGGARPGPGGAGGRRRPAPQGKAPSPPPARRRGGALRAAGPPPRANRAAAGRDRELGGEQVEGRQAVRELLLAGRRRVRELLVANDLDDSPILDEIRDLAREAKVRVVEVSRDKLQREARTEAPQGVVARADGLADIDLDDLARSRPGRPAPFLLALDGITDPGNVGTILRTAEGTGATGILLPRHRAAHVTPTVAKAAAGAIEHLPMALVGGIPSALQRLRDLGVWVVGLDEAADVDLFHADALGAGPLCLVLGAEGKGLGRLTKQRCDALIRIPMHGRLASLNVAQAATAACYEVVRRRSAS